jgi:hypothetical protein
MTEYIKVKIGHLGTTLPEGIPPGAHMQLYHDGFDGRAIVFTWENETPQDCTHPNIVRFKRNFGRKLEQGEFCPDCKYRKDNIQDCTHPNMIDVLAAKDSEVIVKFCPDCAYKGSPQNPLDTPQDAVVE